MLVSETVYDAVRRGSGFFQHGHTFMGHATAVAASLATLTAIENEKLLDNVKARGDSMLARLRADLGDHPNVGDVRGRGLFIGVEFVADKASKAPLDKAARTHNKVQQAAMEQGLMIYGMGGTINGQQSWKILPQE